jgi:hypothetical protein
MPQCAISTVLPQRELEERCNENDKLMNIFMNYAASAFSSVFCQN